MALRIGTWEIDIRPKGWTRLKDEDGGPVVYIQFAVPEAPGGRLDMLAVVMEPGADEPLTGRTWRRIPLATVEQILTGSDIAADVHDIFTSQSTLAAPTLDALHEYFETRNSPPHYVPHTTIKFESDSMVGDGTDGDPTGKFPIVRPPEGRLTDEFLQTVADAYRWFNAAGRSPAPSISETSGVPVRTVHRWIYEARKREILPPARPGRAG
ncbi:hypothetical protein [Streptomyces sp. NPDC020489]|uniref:hypothetical protein n=1 Tax=Streptomyces sp. NPDC020489 TaxID=3365077 RepID=UPI00379C6ADB